MLYDKPFAARNYGSFFFGFALTDEYDRTFYRVAVARKARAGVIGIYRYDSVFRLDIRFGFGLPFAFFVAVFGKIDHLKHYLRFGAGRPIFRFYRFKIRRSRNRNNLFNFVFGSESNFRRAFYFRPRRFALGQSLYVRFQHNIIPSAPPSGSAAIIRYNIRARLRFYSKKYPRKPEATTRIAIFALIRQTLIRGIGSVMKSEHEITRIVNGRLRYDKRNSSRNVFIVFVRRFAAVVYRLCEIRISVHFAVLARGCEFYPVSVERGETVPVQIDEKSGE